MYYLFDSAPMTKFALGCSIQVNKMKPCRSLHLPMLRHSCRLRRKNRFPSEVALIKAHTPASFEINGRNYLYFDLTSAP
jgi:hypothetical protein